MSLCIQCNVLVCDHYFFVCAGECRNIIHAACAGIKKPIFDVISGIVNFSWRCCDCIDLQKLRKQQNERIVSSIEMLSSSIKTINETTTILNNKFESMTKPTPFQSPSIVSRAVTYINDGPTRNTRSNSKQREKMMANVQSYNQSDNQSDNKSQSTKNTSSQIIIGSGSAISTLRTVEPLKWIFISRLHRDVTDDDMNAYIKETFNIEGFVIVRLKNNNSDTRDYVSFKIGIPDTKFNELLASSSWPVGVLIKEFIMYRKNRFLVPRSALTQKESI